MRLLLIILTFTCLPGFAAKDYQDDLVHERFLFGEKSEGRFVQSYYSQPMDTVRFGDCKRTISCEWIGPVFRRSDLRLLHDGVVAALERELAERLQKRPAYFSAFYSAEDDNDQLAKIITELKEDGLENWILNRPGSYFAHNFRSKSVYTKIVNVIRAEMEMPLPAQRIFEADSSR